MVEKRVKKFGQGPPPFSGNARKKSIFLMGGVPLVRKPVSFDKYGFRRTSSNCPFLYCVQAWVAFASKSITLFLFCQCKLNYNYNVQMVDTCDIGRTTRILKELPALGIWYTTIMYRASAKANKF